LARVIFSKSNGIPLANLNATLEEYQIEVPEEAYAPLKHYCQALWEINQTMNLTRHTSYELFVTRDLIDTLELSKLIPEGKQVLDVGSGGGVPGMLLQILRPDLKVALAESIGKKAQALGAIAETIGLDLEIYHCRAEDLLQDFRYDYTTARAVGPITKFCTWFEEVWPSIGRLLAVKGPRWIDEKNAAAEKGMLKKLDLRVVAQYPTPGTEWESVILQIKASR
jgi:16S rRNA (guanine527-N7)-methyltransferase